jgi:hypothetical protein
METYLYPILDEYGLRIESISAKNYTSCIEKISEKVLSKYEFLDDTLEYDDLLHQLDVMYHVEIGGVYNINEF